MIDTLDKRMSAQDVVAELRDGMTIGIGGWATRRKPMALVREIIRSDLKDLTIAAFGGPDVGMLCAAGKVRKLIFPFVSMDQIPLEPYFRKARQSGAIEVLELDEGQFQLGLRAAAMQIPFLPTRIGIGTDLLNQSGFDFKTVKSPYSDAEELVAVPALELDAALIHAQKSDQKGNLLVTSPDPMFDEIFARAARKTYALVEQVVSTEELNMRENSRYAIVERARITGVVEAPYGAHPTSADPAYQLDLPHLKEYAASAKSEDGWGAYHAKYIADGEKSYVDSVGGAAAIEALNKPTY